ncbi:metallophosphoesterase family protein [Streptomyces sp. L7]
MSQAAGLAAYPEIMTRALVEEAKRRGADVLLAAGDISAGGSPADLAAAKRILDGFGTLGRDYLVVRGNHDRAGSSADTFREGFGEGFGGGPGYFAHDLGGLRIIGLDTYAKAGNGGDAGGLGEEQLSWFRARLRAEPDRPTVVFGHHPLTVRDSVFPVTRGQQLDRRQARAIVDAYASAPGFSCTTRAIPTGTSERRWCGRRMSYSRRSPPRRTIPVGFCCGFTPGVTPSTTQGRWDRGAWSGGSGPGGWLGGCGRTHALGRAATDRNGVRAA